MYVCIYLDFLAFGLLCYLPRRSFRTLLPLSLSLSRFRRITKHLHERRPKKVHTHTHREH